MNKTYLLGDTVQEIRRSTTSSTTNPSQHVVIIETGMFNEKQKSQLLNTAKALQIYGHKTTIFTTSDTEDIKHSLQCCTVIEVGKWIPQTIFGQWKYFMYTYRSLYAALRSLLFSPNPKASVYITDCSIYALIVLVFMSRTSVIHMQNMNELIYICNDKRSFNSVLQWIYTKLSSYANEIIVPSVQAWRTFDFLFANDRRPKILYPPIDIDLSRTPIRCEIMQTESIIPEDGYLFVTFGKFDEKSNFKFIMAAFTKAMDILPSEQKSKINLIIAGVYNEHSTLQRKYYETLRTRIICSEYGLNVTLLKNISSVQKKELLSKCMIVLNASTGDIFNSTILEAMCLGKTIITTNSGFAKEIVEHQITGFLLSKDTEQFADIIQRLVRRKILCVYIGILSNRKFKNLFCFNKFSKLLNNTIAKHSVSCWCRKESIQTLYINNNG